MYRLHRTAVIRQGMQKEAYRVAKEISTYINHRYAPVTLQIFLEVFGETDRLHWYTDHENLATMERVGMEILKDEGYRNLLHQANEVLVQGSIRDTLMQSFRLS